MSAECKTCEREFEPRHRLMVFCSRECRQVDARRRAAEWQASHPERRLENQRRYREKHRDRLNTESAARRRGRLRSETERARARERTAEWQRANPEIARAMSRRYSLQRQDRIRGMDEEWAAIVRSDPCSYCGEAGGQADHIVAVSRGGGNGFDNLTGACLSCNASKSAKSLLGFLACRAGLDGPVLHVGIARVK